MVKLNVIEFSTSPNPPPWMGITVLLLAHPIDCREPVTTEAAGETVRTRSIRSASPYTRIIPRWPLTNANEVHRVSISKDSSIVKLIFVQIASIAVAQLCSSTFLLYFHWITTSLQLMSNRQLLNCNTWLERFSLSQNCSQTPCPGCWWDLHVRSSEHQLID